MTPVEVKATPRALLEMMLAIDDMTNVVAGRKPGRSGPG
jgi:hypothetical protein